MGNSEGQVAGARRWWSARVMISEPVSHDGFVNQALVGERLYVGHVGICTKLTVTKPVPPLTPAKVDMIRCTT